jgi:16S rRNA (guanine527-N7)-methyltransferase
VSWPPETDEDGFGPEDVIRQIRVSRETIFRISEYLRVLGQWRERINLIGPGEGRRVWRRHVLDSLQLLENISASDKSLADLGSGAGFPGLVLACALAEREGATVALIEKSVRKSQFLEAAIREVGLPARVLNQRLEVEGEAERFDLVTARALAPLPRLLGYAHDWLKPSGKALLMKGRDAAAEVAEARETWTFEMSATPSLTSPEGQILSVSELRPRRA